MYGCTSDVRFQKVVEGYFPSERPVRANLERNMVEQKWGIPKMVNLSPNTEFSVSSFHFFLPPRQNLWVAIGWKVPISFPLLGFLQYLGLRHFRPHFWERILGIAAGHRRMIPGIEPIFWWRNSCVFNAFGHRSPCLQKSRGLGQRPSNTSDKPQILLKSHFF